MTDLYFACGWVIRPNIDYKCLIQTADECHCELAMIVPVKTIEDGYKVMTFAVRTPSSR